MNAALESALRQAWTKRGPLARLLYPASLMYQALLALRQRVAPAATRLPVPVVVVGNVVVGGAGKTPTTIAIVRHLQTQGWRPGVVSRGFGGRHTGVLAVDAHSRATECGDEPLLIHRATGVPVCVARQRAAAGQVLLAAHPEVNLIMCDDGLQHLALARDLEVVVFDDRGLGNGWCLPAGLLREPWPRRGASTGTGGALVLHQQRIPATPFCPGFVAQRALADAALDAAGAAIPLAELVNTPLVALAGIARPEVFFDMLAERGLLLTQTWALPDHADLSALWPSLQTQCPPGATVLCTEKDAVKLWPLLDGDSPRVLAVPLAVRLEPAFFKTLDAQLSLIHGPQTP